MKLSEKLYESVEEIWNGYYTHPFVQELGYGTLDIDKFRFYMIQDYLYLLEYVKVFALGIVKSKEEKWMREFSRMVHTTLDGEMDIHKEYMTRLGITQEEIKEARQSLANRSYTSYMLEIAYNGGPLEILVAILSCAWSYGKIGAYLSTIEGAKEHAFYGEWVKGYAGEEYARETKDMISFVDEMGKDATAAEIEHLKDIFIRCSRYEYAFWDMSYKKEM